MILITKQVLGPWKITWWNTMVWAPLEHQYEADGIGFLKARIFCLITLGNEQWMNGQHQRNIDSLTQQIFVKLLLYAKQCTRYKEINGKHFANGDCAHVAFSLG